MPETFIIEVNLIQCTREMKGFVKIEMSLNVQTKTTLFLII